MTQVIFEGYLDGKSNIPVYTIKLDEETKASLAKAAEANAIAAGMTGDEWRLQRLQEISTASADFEMAYNPIQEIGRIRRKQATQRKPDGGAEDVT